MASRRILAPRRRGAPGAKREREISHACKAEEGRETGYFTDGAGSGGGGAGGVGLGHVCWQAGVAKGKGGSVCASLNRTRGREGGRKEVAAEPTAMGAPAAGFQANWARLKETDGN
jgi:hypothetical protein